MLVAWSLEWLKHLFLTPFCPQDLHFCCDSAALRCPAQTACVEGLAQRIVRGDVPEMLRRTRLISLDMGALMAGAKFRCVWERV